MKINIKAVLAYKQHLIYFVFMIVMAALINEGVWLVIPGFFFFMRRFPKKYWVYFVVFASAFAYLRVAFIVPDFSLNGENATYEARVVEVRRRTEERQSVIIRVGSEDIFMNFREGEPRLLPGDRLQVTGRIQIPGEPTVPYAFNFRRFLSNQRIHLSMHTQEVEIVARHFSPWQFQFMAADWVQDRLPPLVATYFQAFFLGIRDGIDDEALEAFGDLGILHVFAISGVHVTLLTGILRDFLKRVGLMDVLVDGVLIVFLIAFIFLTGGSVSVVRAASMMILSTVNRRAGWRLSSYDIFSIVFIANFVVNPLILYQTGFIYSYWITFVLISSNSFLRTLTPFKSRLFIPFLARMASLPLQIATGYELNVTSYLSNLLLVPFIMNIIIPGLLLSVVLPPVAQILEIILGWFENFNFFLSPFLNINFVFGSLPLWVVVVLLMMLLGCAWHYERKRKWYSWLVLILCSFLMLESMRTFRPQSFVTFLDVGQGDSTVIRSPWHSCTVVVDTGGVVNIGGPNRSIFGQTLEPYLLGAGVRTIDYLVLTHEHFDHIAEAIPLMGRFRVRNLVISEAEPIGLLGDILEEARSLGVNVLVARPFDTLSCGNQHYTFIHREVNNLDTNEDSLVMALDVDGFKTLLTGDIGFETEGDVLRNFPFDRLDVYQMAHHGSRHSNSLEFLSALNPRYAVVSAGRRNFYGHPSQEMFDVVDALDLPLFSTAEHGTIQFRLGRRGYDIFIWQAE